MSSGSDTAEHFTISILKHIALFYWHFNAAHSILPNNMDKFTVNGFIQYNTRFKYQTSDFMAESCSIKQQARFQSKKMSMAC